MTLTHRADGAAPSAATGAAAPAQPQGPRGRQALWGYAFIAPTGLGLAVFYLWPVLQTAYFSFTEWGSFGGHTWTGLDNYTAADHTTPRSGRALVNTLTYTVMALLGIPLAIVFAALLNTKGLRGVGVYRTLFFLPVVTMPAAIAHGLALALQRRLRPGQPRAVGWSASTGPAGWPTRDTALYALGVVGIWSCIGYNMIIFLAGMQAIPKEYYEAAAIDGAGPVRQFFADHAAAADRRRRSSSR